MLVRLCSCCPECLPKQEGTVQPRLQSRHSPQPQLLLSFCSRCVCFLFSSFFLLFLCLLYKAFRIPLLFFFLSPLSFTPCSSSSSATPSVAFSYWLSDQPATLKASSPPLAPLIYYPAFIPFSILRHSTFLLLFSFHAFHLFPPAVLCPFSRVH